MHYASLTGKCLLHPRDNHSALMTTPGERLRAAREARGLETAKEAADAMGVPKATYVQHESGLRGFPAERAKQYAAFLRTTPEWLLYGRQVVKPPSPPRRSAGVVPLVGYVGAGAEAHFYEAADLGEVDAPDGATENTVAVEIKGTSLGPLFESWLVFYDEVRAPVTHDMIGRLCVVGLVDGRVLVKRIKQARTAGFYHLESNTEPTLSDQEVEWAAIVRSMMPR